jgi:uncharacterized membrane protein
MTLFRPKTLFDKVYEIGIFIKGFDGVLELIGGSLLLFVSPAGIGKITSLLTQHELTQDPHDFIATHILHYGHSLAVGHNLFAALFLLTHGLVKVVLVTCLLLNKLWAYPFALATLGLFLVYQLYEMIVSPSFGMAFLTILDAVIIGLVWREWQKVKA